MMNYEKPIILANEDVAEGVYAASGAGISTDCWNIGVSSVQDWNGSENTFEVKMTHSTGVVHITNNVVITLIFSTAVTNVRTEGGVSCTFSGNTATVTRQLHANGYNSGDTATFKVFATTGDETTTKALGCSIGSYTCTHMENVQGGLD